MAKRYKIGFTEGLNNICTYIQTSDKYVFYSDVLQYSIDYDCFVDLYMNLNIIDRLIIEKNKKLLSEKK